VHMLSSLVNSISCNDNHYHLKVKAVKCVLCVAVGGNYSGRADGSFVRVVCIVEGEYLGEVALSLGPFGESTVYDERVLSSQPNGCCLRGYSLR